MVSFPEVFVWRFALAQASGDGLGLGPGEALAAAFGVGVGLGLGDAAPVQPARRIPITARVIGRVLLRMGCLLLLLRTNGRECNRGFVRGDESPPETFLSG